jgi:hypothetical protein
MVVQRAIGGDSRNSSRVRIAKVLEVDTVRYTASLQFLDSDEISELSQVAGQYVAADIPAWMGAMAKKDNWVLAIKPENQATYIIIAGIRIPTPRRTNPRDTDSFEYEPRSDLSMGSDSVPEGTQGMFGPGGQRVVAWPDGTIDVMCTEACFTRYMPDTDRIVTIAHNLSEMGPWGERHSQTFREQSKDSADDTPVGCASIYRTSAQHAPVVSLNLGSIPNLTGAELAGRPAENSAGLSSIVCRFMVHDQQTADLAASHSKLPSMASAKTVLLVDTAGNIQVVCAGALDVSVGELLMLVRGGIKAQIQERVDLQIGRMLNVEGSGGINLDVAEPITLQSRSDILLRCKRFVVQAVNDLIEVQGDYRVRAGTNAEYSAGGSLTHQVGGDRVSSIGGTDYTSINGMQTTMVSGKAAPENTGRDVSSSRLVVKNGAHSTEVNKGSFQVLMGPSVSPLAFLRIHNDLRSPTTKFRLDYCILASATRLTLTQAGSAYFGSPKANLRIDPAGNIQLGGDFGVAANVVTSLTTCYVTGLPLMGAPNVSVVLRGPSVPGPGLLVTGPLFPIPPILEPAAV